MSGGRTIGGRRSREEALPPPTFAVGPTYNPAELGRALEALRQALDAQITYARSLEDRIAALEAAP